jgi:formiminoglutamase
MSTFDIFGQTERPDAALFYKRNDPNDIRLGEIVSSRPDDYAAAQVVLLGCPQDEGVRRNGGRPGAAQAPTEIRRYFYKLAASVEPMPQIFDLGDTIIQPTLEDTHELQAQIVQKLVEDGKRVIVLGGGNDISYPDCAGLRRGISGKLLAFNIDAHFDVRADTVPNSGTPYRQLLEQNLLDPIRFYEMGSLEFCNSPVYRRYLQEKGAHIYSLDMVQEKGVVSTFAAILAEQEAEAIFWGFDMDAVNVAAAPGVSAPNPLGFSGSEFCALARLAGSDSRSRVVEFSETNPAFDIDGRTSRLVAAGLFYFLKGMLN